MVFAPAVAANASVSAGGWTALDTITAGATNTINAVKGAGATGMRSAVAVAPSAVKVGKHLIKGGGAAALAFAMVELADGGLDWVLDPANNRVKIKVDASGGAAPPGTYPIGTVYITNGICQTASSSPAASCAAVGRHWGASTEFRAPASCLGLGSVYSVALNNSVCVINPPSGGAAPDEYKYIPINTVAAQVVSNAEAGHAPSQEAVKATALEGFAAGEHDTALDAAAVPDTGVENPPDTENPPKDPDAPAEAGIISAINALKALLAGILSSITSLSDFFQSEPPPEKTQKETDVPIDDLPPTKGASEFDINYINFGGQCPVLPSFNVGIGGASSALTFDMTPLCDMALKIRPAVIAIAYFIGLGVIASAIRETQ